MTLLVIAIVGLMVLVVTVSPPQRATQSGSGADSATSIERVPDPDDHDVEATLSADAEGEPPPTIEAVLGDDVQITVEGRGPGSVALGALMTRTYEEGQPATFALLAQTTGAYPLVLIDENRQIGTLAIR
jgi:hypothetical protein